MLLGAFALVGVGMALFIPANSAAIMSSAPRAKSGAAAGILNMTRGMGTALGVAAGTLVFTATTGSGSPTTIAASDAAHGAAVTAAVLAGMTLAAAVVTASAKGRADEGTLRPPSGDQSDGQHQLGNVAAAADLIPYRLDRHNSS